MHCCKINSVSSRSKTSHSQKTKYCGATYRKGEDSSGGSRILQTGGGAAPTYHLAKFSQNCMTMKEIGPGGGRVPGAPLDPPMYSSRLREICTTDFGGNVLCWPILQEARVGRLHSLLPSLDPLLNDVLKSYNDKFTSVILESHSLILLRIICHHAKLLPYRSNS